MEKRAIGRPELYSSELATAVCDLLAQGISLRSVCKQDGMPQMSTVFTWFQKHPEFTEQYARAKQESADALAEELLEIADESLPDAHKADPKAAGAVVQAHRLKVDTRKWLMSKMKPKKYGDKLDVTTDGKALPAPILGGECIKKQQP